MTPHRPGVSILQQSSRAAIYARVSTTNHGQDVTTQTRDLEQFAQARGWHLVDSYPDLGISGSKEKRPEIAQMVTGDLLFAQDVRLPGMLHARSIRPPVAGSTLVSVDGFEGGDPPGLVKVVSKGNYVALVAKTEWQAIQASHLLKVTWKKPDKPVFPDGYEAMYEYLAKTPPQGVAPRSVGDVDAAFASAARTLTATYQAGFQSHAAMTPGCCVADVKDGGATVWFGGQKPYRVRLAIAQLLAIPMS